MEDIVLGAAANYDWPTIEPYAVSLCKSGFSGKKVMFSYGLSVVAEDKLTELGFQIEEAQLGTYLPHVLRFLTAAQFLLLDNEYRYVIWTDVRDVIFQTNPSTWLENGLNGRDLVVASECLNYEDEPWGRGNLYDAFGDKLYNELAKKPIYNCGTLAGKTGVIRFLLGDVYDLACKAKINLADQAALNILLHKYTPYSECLLVPKMAEGFGCICGTTVDRPEVFASHLLDAPPVYDAQKDVLLTPGTGIPFCIVHQYDRTPWGSAIVKRYRL